MTHIFRLGHVDLPSSNVTKRINSPSLLHLKPSPAYADKLSEKPPAELLISGALQVDPLCHLPGAVQRHSHPHCGHRHGDGVDETALRLHPHLTRDLPLQTG